MTKIGHTIHRLDTVASTNTLLLEKEDWLDIHGLVLTALHQTGGRGRMGRRWESVPGAQLQFSVVVHPVLKIEEVPLLALAAGLAVADALALVQGVAPELKWPNDVLIGGKKVCGILVEGRPSKAGGASRNRVVIGIGINCQGGAGDFPPELSNLLTTLAEASGRPVENEQVLQQVLANLEDRYLQLQSGGRLELLDDWRARAVLQGRSVSLETPGGTRRGVARNISDSGYLMVELDSGEMHQQVSGDVTWLD